MDDDNIPKCSHGPDLPTQDKKLQDETIPNNTLLISNEVIVPIILQVQKKIFPNTTYSTIDEPRTEYEAENSRSNMSAITLGTSIYQANSPHAQLVIKNSGQMPIIEQPHASSINSRIYRIPNQPQSLFLQALAKLGESSTNYSLYNLMSNLNKPCWRPGEMTPPDSMTSAPPSYSFVLRQSAARRRPTLMGTFIPSPSFVQHAPPPTYATAFDVYLDPGPQPPPRVYTYGITSMPVVCPECGFIGMTVTTTKITMCTHLCAFVLCLLCCWICSPLPYILRSCKDVYHYCRSCRTYLGRYCPTEPEHAHLQRPQRDS